MKYTRTNTDNYLRFLHDCRLNVENLEADVVEQGFADFGILSKIRNWLWELEVHMDDPVFQSYIADGKDLLDLVEIYRVKLAT